MPDQIESPLWGIKWTSKLTGHRSGGRSGFAATREDAQQVYDDLDRKFPDLWHEPELKVLNES